MKYQYLGRYIIEDNIAYNEDDINDTYELDMFIYTERLQFHGVMSETNTSSIVCKVNNTGETIKFWRAY